MSNIVQIAEPISRKKLRNIASEIRKFCNSENEYYFDVLFFLEIILPTIDKNFEFICLPKCEMPQIYGNTCPEKHRIYIREDVYLGAIENNGRDRFTIAHEISHYILHSKDNLMLARTASISKIPAYYQIEWQANTLAGEILVYVPLIKKNNLSIQEISEKCAVSKTVAKIMHKEIQRN